MNRLSAWRPGAEAMKGAASLALCAWRQVGKVVAEAVGESPAVAGFGFARGTDRMRVRAGRWVGCALG